MAGEARRLLSFKSSTILFNGPAAGIPSPAPLPDLTCPIGTAGVPGVTPRLAGTPPFLISPSRKWPVAALGVIGEASATGVVWPESSPITTVLGRKRDATTMRLDLNDEVIAEDGELGVLYDVGDDEQDIVWRIRKRERRRRPGGRGGRWRKKMIKFSRKKEVLGTLVMEDVTRPCRDGALPRNTTFGR